MRIPVIDLFAGPGGLSEGFARFEKNRRLRFKTVLSIEKDWHAHQTLELRAFFRQFAVDEVPAEYYSYLRGEISRDDLFAQFRTEAAAAHEEAWLAELGKEPRSSVHYRIRKSLSNNKLWVLLGGPPCQAYSIVGRARLLPRYDAIKDPAEKTKFLRRSLKRYEKDSRHFLYQEYLRILADHSPPIFVFENVKGLLSSVVKGSNTFQRIMSDLRSPKNALDVESARAKVNQLDYHLFPLTQTGKFNFLGICDDPADYIVRCEKYGIPQGRHRVFILGLREDFAQHCVPGTLQNSKPEVSIGDAISDLPELRSELSTHSDRGGWVKCLQSIPRSDWFADPSIEPDVREFIAAVCSKPKNDLSTGGRFVKFKRNSALFAADWFIDRKLNGVCNHESRTHMPEDLHRYLFASAFAHIRGRSPKLSDFPQGLLPKHRNVKKNVSQTIFSDRFRVQVQNRPATTITSHISKDGHYFIHWDPAQCRSLTVREAARCQTFSDNYFFEGPRTEQFRQVGNAVPPLLARQIAAVVSGLLS